MAVIDITKDVKQMKEHLDYLIHMNQRLNLILGYAMGFVMKFPIGDEQEKKQYQWLCSAVENIVYHDKPLPPMP